MLSRAGLYLFVYWYWGLNAWPCTCQGGSVLGELSPQSPGLVFISYVPVILWPQLKGMQHLTQLQAGICGWRSVSFLAKIL